MLRMLDAEQRGQRSALVGGVLLVALIAGLVLLGRAYSAGEWLPAFRKWIDAAEPFGPAVYVTVYVLATNVGVPGTPLTMAAGVAFGSMTGLVVAMISSTMSACTMFLIARWLGGNVFESRWANGSLSESVERLLRSRGAWVVAISRLIPFPFLVLNYSFGLTPVPFRTYALWSFVGMIPMNLLLVAGGDALFLWVSAEQIPRPIIFTLLAGAVVLLALGAFARRLLRSSTQSQ